MNKNHPNFLFFFFGFIFGSLSIVGYEQYEKQLLSYKYNQKTLEKNYSTKDQNVIEILFTPGCQCTKRIVDHINQAKKTVLVQAYSFTSKPIIDALIAKHKQGISVTIILDKSQKRSLQVMKVNQSGIQVYIDSPPGIAHNKVIIIDEKEVFTGSFNFSDAAQTKNAENSVLIKDLKVVALYQEYFKSRLKESKKFEQPRQLSKL